MFKTTVTITKVNYKCPTADAVACAGGVSVCGGVDDVR